MSKRTTWGIRTSQQVYHAVRAARLDRRTGALTTEQWRETLLYFDRRCAYCAAREPGEGKKTRLLYLDLFVPAHLGGGATRNNCLPICATCRRLKGSADPSAPEFWDLMHSRDDRARARVEGFFTDNYMRPEKPVYDTGRLTHFVDRRCGAADGRASGTWRTITCEACKGSSEP